MIRAAAAVLALGLMTACGESASPAAVEEKPCGALDTPTGEGALPAALTLPEGQKLLRVQKQGRTAVAFASRPGTRQDLVDVRDAVLEELKKQGFTVVGTDQEPGAEAEAELTGKADGTIRVTPLCEGRLEVRYKIEE